MMAHSVAKYPLASGVKAFLPASLVAEYLEEGHVSQLYILLQLTKHIGHPFRVCFIYTRYSGHYKSSGDTHTQNTRLARLSLGLV